LHAFGSGDKYYVSSDAKAWDTLTFNFDSVPASHLYNFYSIIADKLYWIGRTGNQVFLVSTADGISWNKRPVTWDGDFLFGVDGIS